MKLDDAELTYHQLDCAAARVAGPAAEQGRRGRATGSGSCCPTFPTSPSIYYGILRLGAVVVPMNVLLKRREVGFYLSDPGAKLLFAWHDFAEAAAGRRRRGRRRVHPGQAG